MGNSYYNVFAKKEEQPLNGWFYIFVLYLSFIWVGFYTTESSLVSSFFWSYGKLFDFTTGNFFYEILFLMIESALFLGCFEVLFWFYKTAISYKVYAFVIPLDRFKADARLYCALRNLLYGICLNLCFVWPQIYSFSILFNLIITMSVFLIFVRHIYKKYSEPIIAHFVFKTFAIPMFIYETAFMLFYVWGWL